MGKVLENLGSAPLAARMRPRKLDEFIGQEHIIGKDKILRQAIEQDSVPSLIFWGPPGSGKTTLAFIIAKTTGAEFEQISAVDGGVKEIREVVKRAETMKRLGKKTILFVDEVHRFNKSQQDVLLPHVENGTLTLIGATTENPSFEVNSALLSRSRVFVLKLLEPNEVEIILKNALSDKDKGYGSEKIKIKENTIKFLSEMASGDARTALNALEFAYFSAKKSDAKEVVIDEESIKESLQKSHLLYDKGGEQHYNIISALHKSMRGGDADASLYWLVRMLESGEDPLYVARRVIRFASEDIGLAGSQALTQAVAAYQSCQYIGMPECGINLAQAVVFMAKSKKSNSLYSSYLKAQADVKETFNEPVPLHLRNAPTKLMKNLNYGKGYKYTPEFKNKKDAQQDYFPKKLKGRKYLEE